MPNGRTVLAGSTILERFLQIFGMVLADLDFGLFWNGSCRLSGLSGTLLADFLDFLEHFLWTFWTFWNSSCGLFGLSEIVLMGFLDFL
ncbi:hypothetical protein C1645_881768 [Glomus cerebriforme]|uniref:Uncharacterized protein n=1 Tax=Glomus cerebriforme TaxID=658196 RepID=A0A397S6N2_9GLOM|nr:hypothetical protein C1645_881768 [Glomus cerebriforme]